MTRSPLQRSLAFTALALVLASPAPAADSIVDTSAFPPAQQQNYEVFKVRCSKCHPFTRPLNARMKPDGWRAYVEKMKRRPGSGINPSDGAKILDFLLFREAKRAYEAGEGPAPAGLDGGTK